MAGWTKLFSSIVTSSVWCEDDQTLRVWIAMLALADQDGRVEGSVPGLANLCRVTPEVMRRALDKLEAPDAYSRTKDHDGRRIEPVAGGWLVLNYAAYRERGQAKDGSRAPYYRKYRAQQKDVARNTEERREKQKQSTETDSGDATRPGTKRPRKLPVESANAVKEACEDWTEILGGTAPGARIAGAWPGLLKLAPWTDVRPVWRWYLAEGKRSGKAEFCNAQDFASKFDYWKARALGVVDPDAWKRLRQPESAVEANARVLEAVEQGRL